MYITGGCALAAFITGIWRLPSRKSILKYTFAGIGVGIVISYGYWRYSMINYYKQLNELFRTIVKERYLEPSPFVNVSPTPATEKIV